MLWLVFILNCFAAITWHLHAFVFRWWCLFCSYNKKKSHQPREKFEEFLQLCLMWQWSTTNWHFQKWLNEQMIELYVAVAFRHLCLTVLAWRRVVLRFFDLKQLLRVSCILWCYYSKCQSIKIMLNILRLYRVPTLIRK